MASAIKQFAVCVCPYIHPRLLKTMTQPVRCVRWNSNRTNINKLGRQIYTRMYPTVLVNPDGSTINIRYKEPRKIIKLPFDLGLLTEQEKNARLERKKPKQKIVIEEDIDDGFSSSKYLLLTKKK